MRDGDRGSPVRAALSPGARVTGNEPCDGGGGGRDWITPSARPGARSSGPGGAVGPRARSGRCACVSAAGAGGRSRAARSLSPRDRARAFKYSVLVYVIIMNSNSLPVLHILNMRLRSLHCVLDGRRAGGGSLVVLVRERLELAVLRPATAQPKFEEGHLDP